MFHTNRSSLALTALMVQLQLLDSKISTCVTVANIVGLQMDQGWYYLACRKCNKRVEKKPKKHGSSSDHGFYYDCGKCPEVPDVHHRIRVHVVVQDDTGSMVFCLFDKQVTDMVHRSSVFLISKMKKDDDIHTYPGELDALTNKRYVFKVDVSLFNIKRNYDILTAQRLTDDVAVINTVLYEAESKEVGKKSQQKESQHDEKKVISLDDDIDNEEKLVTSTTVKRSSDHEDNNADMDSSGNNDCCTSYNLKKPKIEKD